MITFSARPDTKKIPLAKRLLKFSERLRERLQVKITVRHPSGDFVFLPSNTAEYFRALSFFSKEEGTIAWLDNFVKQGDVLYDIGANVGLYSLYAGKRGAKVYAFEPHKPNFITLMANIRNNALEASVFPLAVPLADATGMSTLNYASYESGSSMSQVGHTNHPEKGVFTPQVSEKIYCATLDDLVEKGSLPAPQHIKIDVDGNELPILKGMSRLLASAKKPRSVQVEANPGQKPEVTTFMRNVGYRIDHAHYTASGKKALAAGADGEQISHNVVFVPN